MFKFMAINYDNNDSNVIIIIIGTQQAEKQSITERKTFSLLVRQQSQKILIQS